jgi:hypothetical protein
MAFASFLYWGLPEQFQPIKEGFVRDLSRGLPQPFQPFKEGFAGSILTILSLFCAGAADFISGGMTARVIGRRSMHSRWYDARGNAEAHRRQFFLAVLNAEPPTGTPKSEVPLLSQKLEYFRRYQIEVQQSYYNDKSRDNQYGAEKADIVRLIAFVLAFGLSVFSLVNLLARTSEQGGRVVRGMAPRIYRR